MESPRNHNLILLSYLPPPTLGYGLFIQLKDKEKSKIKKKAFLAFRAKQLLIVKEANGAGDVLIALKYN